MSRLRLRPRKNDDSLKDVNSNLPNCESCQAKVKRNAGKHRDGHFICQTCIENVCQCSCEEEIPKITMDINESGETFKSQCRFRTNGCDKVLDLAELTYHENQCNFAIWQCIIPSCMDEIAGDLLLSHLENNHGFLLMSVERKDTQDWSLSLKISDYSKVTYMSKIIFNDLNLYPIVKKVNNMLLLR